MTTLFQAVNQSATTKNGALTNFSSLSKTVDLFFLAGSSRGKDIVPTFAGALAEDSEIAVRILQWARDARSGAGERNQFRQLFSYLIANEPALAARVLVKVPELGRWDDVLVAIGTSLERDALRLIAKALNEGNGLAAKWMPRQGPVANKIRAYMRMTPKAYRKMLVANSKTVEQLMCAGDWTDIKYAHVPSVASARYQKAFGRHDQVGYSAYIAALQKGETKINAGVVYPYDVIRSLQSGNQDVAVEQWKALPNYLEGTSESILPVVDVSGSMAGVRVSGSVTALDVAVSLGLYLSERLQGIFKDQFVTFSSSPSMVKLTGNLKQRYDQLSSSDWNMSTNLQAVFDLILKSAVKNKLPQEALPTKILILSDMEFNACVDRHGRAASAKNSIDSMYEAAGYKKPEVVFWNLNGRMGNMPVTYNESGAALVSGFSPSIVKSVLGGEELTPVSVMLKTVMSDRYNF